MNFYDKCHSVNSADEKKTILNSIYKGKSDDFPLLLFFNCHNYTFQIFIKCS